MERQLKKKKIITFILMLMLAMVYIMIFSFSAEDAEASSAVSVKVTKWLVKIYYRLVSGQGGNKAVLPAVVETEGSIRKLAHFLEYMAMGSLSFGIAIMWMQYTGWAFLLIVAQLIISAGCDEIHQYFVPGRYASVRDVMIDTAGGITGMLIILCIKRIRKQWKHTQQLK